MGKLIQTIKKNFKVLLKNKFSLILLFVGPIMIILLMGFFYYNSNLYNINLGSYVPDNSTNSLIIVSELKKSEFKIIDYTSKDECIKGVTEGTVHGCIFFPENFTIEENRSNKITISLDTSRGDIISITENLLINELSAESEKLQRINAEKLIYAIESSRNVSLDNIELVEGLREVNTELKNNNNKINNYIFQIETLYQAENFEIEDVIERSDRVNSSITAFSYAAEDLLNESEIYLENASSLMQGQSFNNSNEIEEYIDDAIASVKSANRKVASLRTDFNLKTLNSNLDDLKEKFQGAEDTLSQITNFIDDIVKDSSGVNQNFENLTSNIENNSLFLLEEFDKLPVLNSQALVRPVDIEVENIVPNSQIHLTSLFPSLIVSLIFIISIILSSSFILSERKSMAHFRNFMSKNSAFNFLFADFFTLFLIVFMQIFSIIIIYYLFFLKVISLELVYLSLIVIPIIFVFVLLGIIVGYITNSETTNVIFSFLLIFIFLALSGQLLPIEVLSGFLLNLTLYNPFLISEAIIRKFLLFGEPISNMRFDLILITVYFILLFIFNWILESFSKKRAIYGLYVKLYLKTFGRVHEEKPKEEENKKIENKPKKESKEEKKEDPKENVKKRDPFFKVLFSVFKFKKKKKQDKEEDKKEESKEKVEEPKKEPKEIHKKVENKPEEKEEIKEKRSPNDSLSVLQDLNSEINKIKKNK